MDERSAEQRISYALRVLCGPGAGSWRPAAELAQRLSPLGPPPDLMEWGAEATAERQFAGVLEKELTLDQVIEQASGPRLPDDRAENEYFLPVPPSGISPCEP